MVVVKTARELSKMKDACRISAEALRVAGEAVKPGVTTYEIDLRDIPAQFSACVFRWLSGCVYL